MVSFEAMVTGLAFAANESQGLSQNVETDLKSFFPPDSLAPFLIAHFGIPVVTLGIAMITRKAMRRMKHNELRVLISQNYGQDHEKVLNRTRGVAVMRENSEPNPDFPDQDFSRPKVAQRKRAWNRQQKLGRH